MQEFLWELLRFALIIVAGFAPIGFFFIAGVVTHNAAGQNEKARQWMIGLFMAVWVLLLALLYSWV